MKNKMPKHGMEKWIWGAALILIAVGLGAYLGWPAGVVVVGIGMVVDVVRL